jgi:hypothetical protein
MPAIDIEDIIHTFNNAKYVLTDKDHCLIFVWRGGVRVNVYDFNLRAVDTFSSDLWDGNVSVDDIERSVTRYLGSIEMDW